MSEKSPFRPCACDLAEFLKSTGWALYVLVDRFLMVHRLFSMKGANLRLGRKQHRCLLKPCGGSADRIDSCAGPAILLLTLTALHLQRYF